MAQANYYRDPKKLLEFQTFAKYLPIINNESKYAAINNTFGNHFASLQKLVLVKAAKDTIVFPSESEWMGFYKAGSYKVVETMRDTDFYQSNRFGLQTLDKANRIYFEKTAKNHLQFSDQEFYSWLQKYIASSSP